jgi:uncharacterized protein (TIGR03067 family)
MKKLMTTLALATLFSIGAAAQTTAPAPAQDAMPKDLAAIQGTWMIISVNDQALADQGVEMGLTFTGNKYSQITNGAISETGTIKLDGTKKPMSIDLNIMEGDDAGKLQLGIIEITGDTAKGLFAAPGSGTRPADFMSSDGAIFFTAKKVK